MNTIFNISKDELLRSNAFNTAKEIIQQPRLWRETVEIIKENRKTIEEFLNPLLEDENINIIFTGAGTSEFVGNSIVHYLRRKTKRNIESISTTDIVANPTNYLNKDTKTLLISCARSGNSPESVASVELADKIVDDIYHISLTCNPDGHLAKNALNKNNSLTILMPKDSNDLGFAMTGSFTCMSLSGLLIFNLKALDTLSHQIENIASVTEKEFIHRLPLIKDIVSLDKNRIIFLGSSCLKGVAQESSLKVLELTQGKVISDYNSPLGFRHGPKSIVDDNTLVFMFLSSDEYTRKYEVDLVKEMRKEKGNKKIVTVSAIKDDELSELSHYHIDLSDDLNHLEDDAFLIFSYISYAHIFAFFKSLHVENTPDNPCPTGEVNRVVQGVKIYKFEEVNEKC